MININFLGTADQIPSAKRNHTAILLTYNEENILVDCGEGTQRQFRKARLNPCKITRILITHWHGDHILGIPGLLSSLALSGYNKTLYIYGPKGTKVFIGELLKVFGFKKNYDICVEDVVFPKGMTSSTKAGGLKFFETEDFYLESSRMEHGIPCNAYCFVKKGQRRIDKNKLKNSGLPSDSLLQKLKQGKNFSYKGKKYLAKNLTFKEEDKKVSFVLDTLDNPRIVPFVKNSDLLICESEFSSELTLQAKEHLHLTSEQAANIAKTSKSKKLILTHISQRYENNMNKILDESKKVFKNSFVAKDLDAFEVE